MIEATWREWPEYPWEHVRILDFLPTQSGYLSVAVCARDDGSLFEAELRHLLVEPWQETPPPVDTRRAYNMTEAADILGIHRNTLRRIPRAQLRYFRVNSRGDRRYEVADVLAFKRGETSAPTPG